MSDDRTPARIMPGDEFTVSYGNGRSVTVVALAGKRQRELGKLLDELKAVEQSQEIERACELAEEALRLCMDESTASAMWESELDLELAIEIAGSTFAKQSLTADEKKKAGSLH